MKISITCDNFPTQMVGKMAEDFSKHGLTTHIQVGAGDTLFITTEVDDVVKAQIFCILVDSYRFAHGMKGDDSDEEASYQYGCSPPAVH